MIEILHKQQETAEESQWVLDTAILKKNQIFF